MATFQIWLTSSSGKFDPLHTFQAASFTLEDGFAIFRNDKVEVIHAYRLPEGAFIKKTEPSR